MADYYRLRSRVVAGIEKNNGENRRAIYDRARSAMVRQLRAIVPALSESDITRERLALEEAIRRVEAECERNLAVSRRLSPAEIRPVTARQWQPSLGSLPWRRGLHPGWNLNKVRLALWRAVYRIVFVSCFSVYACFWPRAGSGRDGGTARSLSHLHSACLCGWPIAWIRDLGHDRGRQSPRGTGSPVKLLSARGRAVVMTPLLAAGD